MDAAVNDLGVLRQLAASDRTDPTIWSGSIGLAKQDEAAMTQAVLDLNKYFVFADKAAPTRCIDGRMIAGYKDNPALLTRRLGAQVAGATPVLALMYHLVTTIDDTATTLNQDIAHLIGTLTAVGLGYGGHTDDHHTQADEDTGCGAIDKLPVILAKIIQPQAMANIKTLAAVLLGSAWDETIADQLLGRITSFNLDADSYLGRQSDGRYTYKQGSATLMCTKAGTALVVEPLSGAHQEKGLIVNTVARTTFDRDKFAAAHAGVVQLFNYDVWYVQDLARLLFTTDKRRGNIFFTFHILYSLATAMVLTDGSLHLILHQ